MILTHQFVEYVPEQLEPGVLYVSIPYATVVHKCCCGCRQEVVTPLSPTDWELTFDGNTVSLDPSIGNWNFPCQSHYWIKRNRVHWAPQWSRADIDAGRAQDRSAKQRYFAVSASMDERQPDGRQNQNAGLLLRLKALLQRLTRLP